jgi:hypothetical protein
MKIKSNNNKRMLMKDNNETVNINDGEIIQYNGTFYKDNIEISYSKDIIETDFIGIVETHRSKLAEITGIYVKPLYIYYENEWYKIINLKPPTQKYFYYPHLLMLPQHNYVYLPQHFLHTCENRSLNDFVDITKTLDIN